MAASSTEIIPSEEVKTMRIASFDIGKKNFAHYVEEITTTDLESLSKEYDIMRPSKKGKVIPTKSPEYGSFLLKVYATGKRIHTGVYDIRNSEKQDVFDIETRKNLLKHLSLYGELWDTCDTFIIEQQFFTPSIGRRKTGGGQANVDALKIAECLMIWLIDHYPDKVHGYFGASNKTQLLNAPPRLGRKEVKEFGVAQAKILYTIRNDTRMLDLFKLQAAMYRKQVGTPNAEIKRLAIIKTHISEYTDDEKDGTRELVEKVSLKQKLDDVCDACVQLQAYKIKHLVIGMPFC